MPRSRSSAAWRSRHPAAPHPSQPRGLRSLGAAGPGAPGQAAPHIPAWAGLNHLQRKIPSHPNDSVIQGSWDPADVTRKLHQC